MYLREQSSQHPYPYSIQISQNVGEVERSQSRFGVKVQTRFALAGNHLEISYQLEANGITQNIASMTHHFDALGKPLDIMLCQYLPQASLDCEGTFPQWLHPPIYGVRYGLFPVHDPHGTVSFDYVLDGIEYLIQHPFFSASHIQEALIEIQSGEAVGDQGVQEDIRKMVRPFETNILHADEYIYPC